MGSLGYCPVCDGEYCTRGMRVVCIGCGRPRDPVATEPAKDIDELMAESKTRKPAQRKSKLVEAQA